MKPLILFLLLFTCVNVGAQGKFVQAAYTKHIQDGNYFGEITDYNYLCLIYDDTTVKIEISISYSFIGDKFAKQKQPPSQISIGKGKISNDTLSIKYTSSTSSQKAGKRLQLKGNYIPAPNERIFYPPMVFVIKGETIRDLNNDFPVLNKVSPAVAMNMPQPK